MIACIGMSADRNRRAETGDTILVEALDRNPIRLSNGQCSQLEIRPLIGEALICLIQLGWRNSPTHVVTNDVRHWLPGDGCVSLVAIARCGESHRSCGRRPVSISKYTDVADGEVR